MSKIKYLIMVIGIIFGVGLMVPVEVGAQTALDEICANDPTNLLCQNRDEDLMDYAKQIINTMLYIVGALAVIMIVYGGVRYTISAGDAKQVEAAKNTILYSVIGLIVAILAGAIVNFVTGVFK